MTKRCESINVLCQNFLERLIPRTFTCLLWDAEKSSGIFDPQLAPPKMLNGMSAGEYSEGKDYIQSGLRVYRQNLSNKMKEFARTKEELQEEVFKLISYIDMVILTRMPATAILHALLFVQDVRERLMGRRSWMWDRRRCLSWISTRILCCERYLIRINILLIWIL
eukprot:TRINITY_DN3037_c0_g1_i13.p2 TRINITY_DN3037_c0_g1~~TRINITY_DN3037_c0_g1_i13.p2  ORF type:complete len:166 (-),score=36.94 TRINITY_DN3037_c0_g1_i13:203-700(-)